MTLLDDQITPLSHDDLIHAIIGAYPIVFGRAPVAGEVAIYYAQCLVENGARLDALHRFGIGNVKATSSWTGDTVTYQCQEVFSAADTHRAQALGPCTITPLTDGRFSVVLPAGHPWAVFRAFEKASDALRWYLQIFALPRYAEAARRARAGDAVGFVMACHAGGYFTADPGPYERAVASISAHALPACTAALAGQATGIDDGYRETVQGLVALTLDESTRDTDPAPPNEVEGAPV